ncbi:MAG: DUF1064 domain-containing protein [Clostridia bacterium]|nr:DUF1064 domain-containing protein [Clostridia bacterium]
MPKKSKSKYNARKINVDGILFDSQAEANFYCQLKLLLRAGEIEGFCRQARFIVTEGKNGEKGTEYVTDFIVFLPGGKYRIVDVKGVKTDTFKLKIKCLREKYPKLKVELEV